VRYYCTAFTAKLIRVHHLRWVRQLALLGFNLAPQCSAQRSLIAWPVSRRFGASPKIRPAQDARGLNSLCLTLPD
jgi:hypothetical protein